MKVTDIELKLREKYDEGLIDSDTYKSILANVKHFDKDNFAKGVAELHKVRSGEDEWYNNFVQSAKQSGDWDDNLSLTEARQTLHDILLGAEKSYGKSYLTLLDDLDNPEDADLYAAFLLNIPEIKDEIRSKIGSFEDLYRVSTTILEGKKREKKEKRFKADKPDSEFKGDKPLINLLEELPENHFSELYTPESPETYKPEDNPITSDYSLEDEVSSKLEDRPADFPSDDKIPSEFQVDSPLQQDYSSDKPISTSELETDDSDNQDSQASKPIISLEDKKRLFYILREKAKRDTLKYFLNSEAGEAILGLEKLIDTKKNTNVQTLYQDQIKIFANYRDLQDDLSTRAFINSEFEHPVTGEKDVLPSLHQTIAIYHNLLEKRYGIFDDMGTGKTAIASLLKPLIAEKLKKEGKKVTGRTLVIGPKSSSKAWSDGLEGELSKRYFSKEQKVAWVNGKKDKEFLEEMAESDFIFANFEQLLCDFEIDGKKKKVYQVLYDLGFDNIIVDEVHGAKNHKPHTKSGSITASYALRILATKPGLEYLSLLSGTPMPDNLGDYANIYFMLRPQEFDLGENCVDFKNISSQFYEKFEGNPRTLYSLTRENTIRRTSDEVTDLPGFEEIIEDIELTNVQKQIVDYVFDKGDHNWLTQIRYALLDPRLVSPTILQELGLVGEITRKDSAKYLRLEKILSSQDSPLAKGEKVIIFSGLFADGITRDVTKLKKEYDKLGLSKEFETLGITNLKSELEEILSKRFDREINLASIHANTSDVERSYAVDGLNNGLDGVVCTCQSGGVSLNFSAASTAIFLDQHYSPASTDQAVARIIRRGQKHPAKIIYLMGKDSFDYPVQDLINNKRNNIQMALDGIELLDKEKELLWGGNNKDRLKDLFLRRRGGMTIDLSSYDIDSIDDFDTKKVTKRLSKGAPLIIHSDIFEQTVAQEIRKRIADDPVNCWFDRDFVQLYTDNFETLGPYLLARAKVTDLVRRSLSEEIEFPKLFLADAAAHGILYSTMQDLENLIESNGFSVPTIVDRDFSTGMHELSPNPLKYLANMCGDPRVFNEEFFEKFGKFDFIDNSSITLLPNKERLGDYILETNRILKSGGYLQLGVGGWYFSKDFFKAMKNYGFKPVVRSVRHFTPKTMQKALKERFGTHFSQAYASKLKSTNFSIFRKIDDVFEGDPSGLLLENPEFFKSDENPEIQESDNPFISLDEFLYSSPEELIERRVSVPLELRSDYNCIFGSNFTELLKTGKISIEDLHNLGFERIVEKDGRGKKRIEIVTYRPIRK